MKALLIFYILYYYRLNVAEKTCWNILEKPLKEVSADMAPVLVIIVSKLPHEGLLYY